MNHMGICSNCCHVLLQIWGLPAADEHLDLGGRGDELLLCLWCWVDLGRNVSLPSAQSLSISSSPSFPRDLEPEPGFQIAR